MQSQTDDDWKTLGEWLFAKIEQGDAAKKPSRRCWFLKNPASYFEAASQWKRKDRPGKRDIAIRKPWRDVPPQESTSEDKAALAEFLKPNGFKKII